MWPATLPPNLKSKAEGKIFGRLQSQLDAEWTVLHSLGLTGHVRKPWAEIDFVVIGPLGLFCLEVKGGRIRRDVGQWIFTDGDGRDHLRNEGPFEQVGGASAALHKHLAAHGRRDVAVHYAVVTPDVRFHIHGPEIGRAHV